MERHDAVGARGDGAGLVRGAGGAYAGRGGGDLRGRGGQLRPTRRAGVPVGRGADESGCRAGVGGGGGDGPLGRPGRGATGGAEGRRCLPAGRSGVSGAACRLHAGRRTAGVRAHRQPCAGGAVGRTRRTAAHGRRAERHRRAPTGRRRFGRRAWSAAARPPHVRDVHLGVDRDPEGSGGHPPVGGQPSAGPRRGVRLGGVGPVHAHRADGLRPLGVADVLPPGDRRQLCDRAGRQCGRSRIPRRAGAAARCDGAAPDRLGPGRGAPGAGGDRPLRPPAATGQWR